jgi:hypothetical protein
MARQCVAAVETWKTMKAEGKARIETAPDSEDETTEVVNNNQLLEDFLKPLLEGTIPDVRQKYTGPKLPAFSDMFKPETYKQEWENLSGKQSRIILAKALLKEMSWRAHSQTNSSTYKQYKRLMNGWRTISGKILKLPEEYHTPMCEFIYDGFHWNTARLADTRLLRMVYAALDAFILKKIGRTSESDLDTQDEDADESSADEDPEDDDFA